MLAWSTCMKGSRRAHRVIEATASRDVTLSPSWKNRPSRSVKIQVRRSSETCQPSTICGLMAPEASCAQSWS
jgi:hypothetical protein